MDGIVGPWYLLLNLDFWVCKSGGPLLGISLKHIWISINNWRKQIYANLVESPPQSSWIEVLHQQRMIPSGRNGSVRGDAVRQRRETNAGGGLLRARRQYHSSRCISPSDCRFAVSSRSVGLYKIHTLSLRSFDLTRSFHNFVEPCGRVVSYLLTLILRSSSHVNSWSWHGEIERDDLTSCS